MADLSTKGPFALNALSATDAAAKIAAGEITSEAMVADCLARIEAREGTVHAWAFIDPDYALEQARACDAAGAPRGALHGVPVGIKDILDTKDMPTGHGSAIYRGDRPGKDSACVAALREVGAVILGKTVTTEFASPYPAETRNPHDITRTPGVSSSGSAAAVADFMVPLANGTQTGGSVIGPSGRCGVYGYKASLDGLDRGGIRHLKPNLDTLGLFARSIPDLALMRAASHGRTEAASLDIPAGHTPRIGICRTPDWNDVTPAVAAMFDTAERILTGAGANVSEVTLPVYLQEIAPDFSVISGVEGSRALTAEARDHFDSFNPWSKERYTEGAAFSEERYRQALANTAKGREVLSALFADYDVFITPTHPDEAPQDVTSVINAAFNRLWTQMYTPAIHLPLFTGPAGMPLGFQVIGPQDADDSAIAFAHWIDQRMKEAMR